MASPSEKYKECDFSILCERYPINSGKATYRAKVLYISLKNKKGDFKRIYYDKISEMNMENIKISSRKIERGNSRPNLKKKVPGKRLN